jgi:hypothetical protein
VSYEVWGEPDDPPELPDGCIDPDDADDIRALFQHINIPDPSPGDRSTAALILIDHILHYVPTTPPKPEDPSLIWARALMRDVVC